MKIIVVLWILVLVCNVQTEKNNHDNDPENSGNNNYKSAAVIRVILNNGKQIDQLLPLKQHMNVSKFLFENEGLI